MSHYRIILRGVTEGRSVDEVAQSLARFSKKPPETLRTLLTSGRDVVAKRSTEVQHAMKYKQALENIGCVCVIQAAITAIPEGSSADRSTSVLVTNLTSGRTSAPVEAKEYQYANPPLGMRMRGVAVGIGVAAATAAAYYGWINLN